jgi:hypothetical protein
MAYFDGKIAIAGQLGLAQGYVGSLKWKINAKHEENKVSQSDLEYVAQLLKSIETILFKEEREKL